MKGILAIVSLVLPMISHSQEMHKRGYAVNCGNTDEIMTILSEQYGESLIGTGITHDSVNSITSLWFNAKTGTFTMLQTHNETSCIVSTGQELEIDPNKVTRGESI